MNPDEVEIRALDTQDDLLACVALQRETWGREFTDVVPPSILKVSQRLGGVAAGAFGRDGRLLGFVYGFTGVERGRIVHWSDMLAVVPGSRNLGIGRRLKEYQRRVVQALGAEVIYWTYDPLVARNAHLNFNVFGVWVTEYVENMYGDTESELHRGIGTDRFVVAWPVQDRAVARRLEETHASGTDPLLLQAIVLNAGNRPPLLAPRVAEGAPDRARVEVPLDINALQRHDPAEAGAWRQSTRTAFQLALGAGLLVQGFVIDDCARRGYYLLGRQTS